MTKQQKFVLCLHPLGSDAGFWRHVFGEDLPPGYVTTDLPGHGLAAGLTPTSLEAYSAPIANLLRGARTASPDACICVVGVSLGGLVAQQLSLSYPDLIDCMALVDTVPVYPSGMREMWRSRAAEVEESGPIRYSEATLSTWFTDSFMLTERGRLIAQEVTETLRRTSPSGYAAACMVLATADLSQVISKMDKPTLVVCGDQEAPAFSNAAQWLERQLPGAQLAWLSRTKHAGVVEANIEFRRILSEFVARCSAT